MIIVDILDGLICRFPSNVSVHPRRTLCAVVVERIVGNLIAMTVFKVDKPFFSVISDDDWLNAGRNITHITPRTFLLPRWGVSTFTDNMNICAPAGKMGGKYMRLLIPGIIKEQPFPSWIE